MKEKKFNQYFATLIVILSISFLLYTVIKFANGFFGALLLYVLFFPFYNFMIKKNINKKLSAGFVIFIAFLVIIIPLLLVLALIGNEVAQIFKNPSLIEDIINLENINITKFLPSFNTEVLAEKLTNLGTSIMPLFVNLFSNIGSVIINIVIAFFLLYFMLIQGPLFDKIKKIIPFNEKNRQELVVKLKEISRSTVLVGGIIALIQGGLIAISFLIFGINGAFVWGFIAAILSFLPMIGPPVIWIPVAIFQLIQGDYFSGVGILIFGLVSINVDDFIRPYLGKSIAKIHPLVTLIGIFVGIPLFGLIGVFVGPLLIAFSVLVLKSYQEEYIN
ncbi:MAG: AI-2E family transporter [Candidatus Woesearchaeota archaeon]